MIEMTSRERMLAAFDRKPFDRVPTDIWATGEVWRKLADRFGSPEAARRELRIDGMAGPGPAYTGPELPAMPEGESINFWGMKHKAVDYGTGLYHEQYFAPLAFAETVDDLDQYRWPSADWFAYSEMPRQAAEVRATQVVQCGYMAVFYYHNQLRGLEQSLLDPLENPELTHALLDRLTDFFVEDHRRRFEACRGLIDVAQVTDDLGTQTGPMISMEVFREFYKPRMQRCIDLCKAYGIRVMHHDDGAIRAFLPELVGMGIDILNPVQWRCPGMGVEGLKRDFGEAICFHGAVDNQQTLPHGTPDDVRAEARRMIDALASDGTGYVLAPCHNIQPVTPVENIIAMYDEAYQYGCR